MTSPQRSLHPASGNDRGSLLSALELVAGGGVQPAQVAWAEIGQSVALEPSPQVLHGTLFFETALVQSEQAVGARKPGDDRDVVPVGSVPKPCSVGLCGMAAGSAANCAWSNWAGRPGSGTARNASMPPSWRRRFHVYTVWRATPTANATSVQALPHSGIRAARTRFLAASLNRGFKVHKSTLNPGPSST